MPEKSSELVLNKETKKITKRVVFMDSPAMSTYLLAFCVGEFDFVQGQTKKEGVLVRVLAPPGKAASGKFALNCATKALDIFDEFFGTPYPLPKLDMVAIPEFSMGAMENWGLVTYRESDLLVAGEEQASTNQKQRICSVVTYELAHQWFGNLVTMSWWDGLWLNEGFASWCEHWANDKLFPEWNMWDQFRTGRMAPAMRLDALRSSHPVQVPIKHAEEVEEVFDVISYCKGSALVQMVRAVIGTKQFQNGLRVYMKRHAYRNTEPHDLWAAWERSSGMPVRHLMASWTEQMGFPMVRITKEIWKEDKVILSLDQNWFLSDGLELTEAEMKKTWTIPILACTAKGMHEDLIFMREKTASITIPLPNKDGWVKINARQEVPMRVQLSESMLERLKPAITKRELGPSDRAGLLSDAFALVKAGHQTPEYLISLLSAYYDEDSYVVWQGIGDVLNGLNTVVSDDEEMSVCFGAFARGLILNTATRIGWDPSDTDGPLTGLLRGVMIGLLDNFCHNDEGVAAEAKSRFDAFMADPSNNSKILPDDSKTAVFSIVLKNGSLAEYEQVLAYFDKADTDADKKCVFSSLGTTKDPVLKKRTLDWSISGAAKLQDSFYAMGPVGKASRMGREVAWEWFQENFHKIRGIIGKASTSLMSACITSCAGKFCSHAKIDEVMTFFEENPMPLNARKIAQMTDNMRSNAKFLDKLKNSTLAEKEFW
eukprot:CAMPEP_0118704208 /NCGR_PEP_ID=MMETSP0800-20121206/19082_1 /TAXON_ID=210618 ORGANISM="Striatella unipunctata, Strain CCMP2910" /NCGR_SAMPLE_ID=MMETSP0800 /ASSEMBLY_ACC=CAM_ASM_000638 /LENGTH=712 /DNA_ID=CAMNT_0006606021 /DNA_START=29 /DNA_END=2164 /DNA_ORIENTATION=+